MPVGHVRQFSLESLVQFLQIQVPSSMLQNSGAKIMEAKGKAIGMCNDEMTPALQIILLRSSVGLRAAKLCGQGSSD